jgi:hypothetical protein
MAHSCAVSPRSARPHTRKFRENAEDPVSFGIGLSIAHRIAMLTPDTHTPPAGFLPTSPAPIDLRDIAQSALLVGSFPADLSRNNAVAPTGAAYLQQYPDRRSLARPVH